MKKMEPWQRENPGKSDYLRDLQQEQNPLLMFPFQCCSKYWFNLPNKAEVDRYQSDADSAAIWVFTLVLIPFILGV